jgi:DNA-binding protein HU-beta
LGGRLLNKAELVAAVAERTELTKKDSERAVAAVFDAISEALANGEKVQLVGFGTFEVKERGERKGRNPQTREEILIPACKVPGFKAGKTLRKSVQ